MRTPGGASTSARASAGPTSARATPLRAARPRPLQAKKKGGGGPTSPSPPTPTPPAADDNAAPPAPPATPSKKPAGSRGTPTTTAGTGWGAEVDALGRDRLDALGKAQDYNINVTHGQNLAHLDSLFVGKTLG